MSKIYTIYFFCGLREVCGHIIAPWESSICHVVLYATHVRTYFFSSNLPPIDQPMDQAINSLQHLGRGAWKHSKTKENVCKPITQWYLYLLQINPNGFPQLAERGLWQIPTTSNKLVCLILHFHGKVKSQLLSCTAENLLHKGSSKQEFHGQTHLQSQPGFLSDQTSPKLFSTLQLNNASSASVTS